jgi:hypothetical protein
MPVNVAGMRSTLLACILVLLSVMAARADLQGSFQSVPLALGGGLVGGRAVAGPEFGTVSPGLQCRHAVRDAGRAAGIPDHLMSAIARVESGRPDPQGGVQPWPWSINVEGTDHVYETKAEAIAAVRAFQARGSRSIDVGCMQVNLLHHPEAFATLEQAFDPAINAAYAAKFLLKLFAQTGSWPAATAAYHSATPELGAPYQRKVQSVLAEEQRRDDEAGPARTMTAMNTAPAGLGAIMLGNRSQSARLLAAPPGAPQRGLDAYRAAPVPIASRQPFRLNR